MLVSVFFWSKSGISFKNLDKVALGRKGEIICNIDNRFIGVTQKMCCLFNFFLTDIITDGNTEILFENAGKIIFRESGVFCKGGYGNPFFDVTVNIIHTLHYRFGKNGTFFL